MQCVTLLTEGFLTAFLFRLKATCDAIVVNKFDTALGDCEEKVYMRALFQRD